MRIDILTLFPEEFSVLKSSILSRAEKKGLLEINLVNIRDFTLDKNGRCDDEPFGGGAGMVLTPQPLYDAIMSVKQDDSYIIITSPRGTLLKQDVVVRLSKHNHLIIVCGHYEGIDQRIIDMFASEEISLGDFVLTGGEIAAMAIADAVSRYVPGVIKEGSLSEESFSSGLLEYPQFTRPQNFKGIEVPAVLISGDHKKVDEYRKEQSLEITRKNRPDLLGGGHVN